MDLGLAGKTAIVCGASQGLGYACAAALAAEGVHLVIAARTAARLEAAAAALRATGVTVQPVACDLQQPDSIEKLLAACPAPDILVTNSGGPPVGDFRRFSRDDWHAAIDSNMVSAIMLIGAVIEGMCARHFGRIVTITSGAVKAPLPFLALSNSARAGLIAAVKGLSRDVAADNVTINNVMPGPFATERLAANFTRRATLSGEAESAIRAESLAKIPAGRFGDPAEFGALCASLCSARLGYLTGQSILIDGGAFPGLL